VIRRKKLQYFMSNFIACGDSVESRITNHESHFKKMAERTGLEPATPGVTGRYSNQLNYRSARKPFLSCPTGSRIDQSQREFRATEVVGADGIEPPTFAL
jgi:hypothetical protein